VQRRRVYEMKKVGPPALRLWDLGTRSHVVRWFAVWVSSANTLTTNTAISFNLRRGTLMESNARNFSRSRPLLRWFLGFAAMGGIVPFIVGMTGPPRGYGRLAIVFLLWPTSLLVITDPSDFVDKLVLYSLSIGLNAALYGCFGLLLGFCIRGVRKEV
jgi:hypothetical protein